MSSSKGSRLGRNPLQKKKASAAEKIVTEEFVAPQADSPRASVESKPRGLVDRLGRMDIRLDIPGILRHLTK